MLNIRKKIIISSITIIVLIFGCINRSNGLKQEDIKPIIKTFLIKHVQIHRFNDEISKKTLKTLLNYLDPGKYYFFKNDINKLYKYEFLIDDFVIENKYDFLFEIFKLYQERFSESQKFFSEIIEKKFDFNKDEYILIDRDKIDYAKTEEEIKERLRKKIKLQLLNILAVIKDIKKAKKKLKKKYHLLEKRMKEIDNNKMISIFVNSFSTALDPHSNYLTNEEHEDFMISTKLKLEGIGVLLSSEDGFITVESIIPGGAADKLPDNLQLKPNDKIIAVSQSDNEPIDVIDMALRDVVKLIRGTKGTEVRLSIIREIDNHHKQSRLLIPIIREEIKLQDKAAKSEIYTHINKSNKIKKSTTKIGYIKLPSFYLDFDAIQNGDSMGRSSSRDIITQLSKLKKQKIEGIVIDLRGNPGGALNEAINIAGMFIDQGPVVQILAGKNHIEVLKDNDPALYYDGPIVVLINKFSASASEIFAGAIKDYKRGIIIGSNNSFGKGSVQTYNVLPAKKGAMKITTALFYQPAGTSNQLNGIIPDIIIPDISTIFEIGEDKLSNALKWKRIKKAKYIPYKNFQNKKIISTLLDYSSKRIANTKKFNKLTTKINKLKSQRNKKTISLKEEAKLKDQKSKDMERRKKNARKKVLIDLENDLFLQEAFNITADYINIIH